MLFHSDRLSPLALRYWVEAEIGGCV